MVKGTITPGNITFSQEVDLQAGETKTVKFDKRYFPQMVVNNPKLWWPNGYGEPHLYTCRLEVVHEGKTSKPKNSVSAYANIHTIKRMAYFIYTSTASRSS